MLAFISENFAPLMFCGLFCMLLIGFPVAFALAATGIGFGVLGIYCGVLQPEVFQGIKDQIWGRMEFSGGEKLLAIPFFTLMGLILERSGMAEDLLDTIGQLFGPIRGGLAYAVIFVGALLAATTGVVAAAVISMGLISLPVMLRYGYDKRVASGVIAASGTLAQIIPPSLVLIIMAESLGKPIGDMYKGAMIPGLILCGLYVLFIFSLSIFKPKLVPALPLEARQLKEANGGHGLWSLLTIVVLSVVVGVLLANKVAISIGPFFSRTYTSGQVPIDELIVYGALTGTLFSYLAAKLNAVLKLKLLGDVAQKVIFVMVPPLALIFFVLGTIFLGIASPTAGGAMGAAGAIALAVARKRLTWDLLRQAIDKTAKLSTFVVFILVGSRVFSYIFSAAQGDHWVTHLLQKLPGGQLGFLLVVSAIVFVLAFFLDFFELALIVVPFLVPAAKALNIDLIWFGVILSVNLQTSFMHPPFGFSLFYLRSVAPKEVKTTDIYWGAIPYVVIQLIMVGIVIAIPSLAIGDKANNKNNGKPPAAITKELPKSTDDFSF